MAFGDRLQSLRRENGMTQEEFAEQLKDIAVLDKPAKVEGRNMAIVISPKK